MSEKLYNYLYKITNTISGKYYIGIHSTNNIDDGYMGSGSDVKRDLIKYGKNMFIKSIIKMHSSRAHLVSHERIAITEDIVLDTNSYNMKMGGASLHPLYHKRGCTVNGTHYPTMKSASENESIKMGVLQRMLNYGFSDYKLYKQNCIQNRSRARLGSKASEAAKKNMSNAQKGRIFPKERRKRMSIAQIKRNIDNPMSKETKEKIRQIRTGKKHTIETRKKMSIIKLKNA